MAFIDNVKPLTVEDFKEEFRRDGEIIAENYNYFSDQVTETINGRIDYENLAKSRITIDITVDSSGIPTRITQFSDIPNVSGISVLRAINLTNSLVYPNTAPFVSFNTINSGFYEVKHVTGLPANNNFRLTLELTP